MVSDKVNEELQADIQLLASRTEYETSKTDNVAAVLEEKVERLEGELELERFYKGLLSIILFDAVAFPHIGVVGILFIGFFEFILVYVFSKYCNVIGLHDCLHACYESCIKIIHAFRKKV